MSDKKKPFFHYRNAFKSDHLAAADIEELVENNGKAILTLDRVEYFQNRQVAGRTKDKGLVAFFKEPNTKPMIVNAVNSKVLQSFIKSNDLNNDWFNLNLKIELYVNDSVKMSGKTVGGIRIKTRLPIVESKVKILPAISEVSLKKAIAAVKGGTYKLSEVKAKYTLTDEQEKLFK